MADEKKSRGVGELTVKVSADVGEALTGFKALQRELRETMKALRELEQAYEDVEKAVVKSACADCGGSGFVSIGEGIRGVKKCVACRKGTSEDIERAFTPPVFELQTQALKDAVENEEAIPDKLREHILAKFAEDEAKIVEFVRKLNE